MTQRKFRIEAHICTANDFVKETQTDAQRQCQRSIRTALIIPGQSN